ncbi:MAG: phasin family protein [Marinomonas sp.]
MATNSKSVTDTVSKIDAAAEKAYADAAATPAVTEAPAVKAEPAKKAPAKKAAPKKTAKKAAPKKAAAKKAAPKKAAAKRAAKSAPKKSAAAKTPAAKPVSKLKDTIMAKAKDTNFTENLTNGAKDMAADAQTRVKVAAAKAGEFAGELNEFNKDNLEAVVESGKILFAGAQEMGREQIATTKTVASTVTTDVKKMVAVKSPTELVQLQGEIARRNVDAAIAFGSKNTEAWLKIYNDAFAPISSRVSVAAERIKKAA